jgi:hypothetical protein
MDSVLSLWSMSVRESTKLSLHFHLHFRRYKYFISVSYAWRIYFLAHSDHKFTHTNPPTPSSWNVIPVRPNSRPNPAHVCTFWLRKEGVAPACRDGLPRCIASARFCTGAEQSATRSWQITAASCKFTGTLTLIRRVVAKLYTIIHVLLHPPFSPLTLYLLHSLSALLYRIHSL